VKGSGFIGLSQIEKVAKSSPTLATKRVARLQKEHEGIQPSAVNCIGFVQAWLKRNGLQATRGGSLL
tara:strand:- start:46 stop:246 length:201 start_codon:yes stop_codon:yes gene_type:complete